MAREAIVLPGLAARVGMSVTGLGYALAAVARMRGDGDVAVPVALGVATLSWSVLIATHLHWWDEVRLRFKPAD